MTVQQVVDLLVAEKEKAEKSKSYVQQLRNCCDKFAQAFQMEIHRLTTEMLIRYFDNLKGAPVAAGIISRTSPRCSSLR